MAEPTYKNITATVRPHRCAILINEGSKYWKAAASGAIRCASEVWGGRYFLLIPTDGTRIKEKFWEILEAYSPDYVGVYGLSFSDLEEADPKTYAEVKAANKEQFEQRGFDTDFEEWFTGSAAHSQLDELVISDGLQKELLNRLSPFHFQGEATRQRLSRRSGFGFPFTKISKIISFSTRQVGEITLPKAIDDPTVALLIHSQTGIADPEYCAELKQQNLVVNRLPDNYDTTEFLGHVLGSQSPVYDTDSDHWSPADDYMPRTPFGLSMLHLGQYYRADQHRQYKEPAVVVLGDTVDDFCLYYSLSRLHERVCWLPLSWLRNCYRTFEDNRRRSDRGEETKAFGPQDSITRMLINLFFQLIDYGHHDKRIELRSVSLSVRQLVAYRRQVLACTYVVSERYTSKVDCVPTERSSTDCILRVFEENNYTNHRSVVFMNGETVSPFDTPKPKNFSAIHPSDHHWITSLRIEGYEPPSLASLGTQLVNIHGLSTESRVANDGIAYDCPNIAYFGGDVDVVLVRPKVKMLDEMALLAAYFGEIGVGIGYSDKGNYFRDTLLRFGGLSEAGQFIKSAATRSVLDKFMSKTNAGDGSVIFLTNDQRAYLSLNAIIGSLGDEKQAADLADKLLGQRVLQRGYIFQCERCRLSSWYSIDVLTADFVCNRCSFRQQFTRTHWKQPIEPHWYFKLAETVYQFYANNSHLTVQALYKLQSESTIAFHYVPEIDLIGFPNPGEKKELDIACIVDGQIVLGECKTELLRPRDAARFETLVGRLGKRPSRIVFATTHDSVTSDFSARIGRLSGAEIFTFADMYDI